MESVPCRWHLGEQSGYVAYFLWLNVDHDMELTRKDQDSDAAKHPLNDRGRNGAKVLAPLQQACDEL